MAISELYVQNGVTVGTTEYSLTNNSTTIATQTSDAVLQVFLDPANMAGTDEYELKVYEKVYGAGTARVIFNAILANPQNYPLVTPSIIVMHGWDVTLKKNAGTDRAFDWSIRAVT